VTINDLTEANKGLHLADLAKANRDRCHIVIAAWGVHGAYRGRGAEVARRHSGLQCLGTTKAGHPRHPLYVRGDTRPVSVSFVGTEGWR
jgi:hypothetical protein